MGNIAEWGALGEEYENAGSKNAFIRQTSAKYLAFYNTDLLQWTETEKLLTERELLTENTVLFFYPAEDGESVRLNTEEMLLCFSLPIAGFVFDRALLRETGCFNERLEDRTNYELLCRLTEAAGECTAIPLHVPSASFPRLTKEGAETYAYVFRRYFKRLHAAGCMEEIFGQLCAYVQEQGLFSLFQERFNRLLSEEREYRRIAEDTGAFAIVHGDDTCYGVLRDFADRLAEELAGLGQAVAVIDDGNDYERLSGTVCKGVVGFQSPALEIDLFQGLGSRMFQFWFDHPVRFGEHFRKLSPQTAILCQDGNHALFLKKYFGMEHAIQFPPGGMDAGYSRNEDRPYDIVFIGSYFPVEKLSLNEREQQFLEYMMTHPWLSFEEGLERRLAEEGIYLEPEDFVERMNSLYEVRRKVTNDYRKKVIEIILEAGYQVHVYGDSWKMYQGAGAQRLILHPEVTPEEALQEWGKARIGLNVMRWHKAGMTERIANILLSGAVCLTERNPYLEKHFSDGQDIVFFQLERLNELPDKIGWLLREEEIRKRIAGEAYEKALREHTWRQRALTLLQLLEEEE